MPNRMLKNLFFLIVVSVLFLFSCSKEKPAKILADPVEQKLQQSQKDNKYALLFFINPRGKPCQLQNKILSDMYNEISGRLNYIYLSTSKKSDMTYFYSYGIRALPTIIILDQERNVSHRFAPGIISKEALIEKINSLK